MCFWCHNQCSWRPGAALCPAGSVVGSALVQLCLPWADFGPEVSRFQGFPRHSALEPVWRIPFASCFPMEPISKRVRSSLLSVLCYTAYVFPDFAVNRLFKCWKLLFYIKRQHISCGMCYWCLLKGFLNRGVEHRHSKGSLVCHSLAESFNCLICVSFHL